MALFSSLSSSAANEDGKKQRPKSHNRLVYGKDDILFGSIEERQGDRPFGRVLDAGTGMHSLRWIATLSETLGMEHVTCITADETMRKNVQREADDLEITDVSKVIIGNWFGPDGTTSINLKPESFDVILADYLIGAMDGFSPYQQDLMLPKLVRYLKPGGRLYIVGLEPLPDKAPGDANIICKVRQVRDACILLGGHRCYREYPMQWMERQIEHRSSHLKLIHTSTFPILYRHQTIVNQINVGRSKFSLFPTKELAASMKKVMDDLEAQSLEATSRAPNGRIRLGFDYVITAEKTDDAKAVTMEGVCIER
eukprot:CAMPEP_0198133258 /NCGR_PEP_ID=MMETSP1442-20131203/59472_1 /TAXON_ID= /ORGANISM="Craspedostauros australis, Strain CCMP3328" /LENGTH=310 /DNA_ID=CAMNT_0043794371 /DNA_START=671 /DNA_END=1603 /DNA_ORIENTATION=-